MATRWTHHACILLSSFNFFSFYSLLVSYRFHRIVTFRWVARIRDMAKPLNDDITMHTDYDAFIPNTFKHDNNDNILFAHRHSAHCSFAALSRFNEWARARELFSFLFFFCCCSSSTLKIAEPSRWTIIAWMMNEWMNNNQTLTFSMSIHVHNRRSYVDKHAKNNINIDIDINKNYNKMFQHKIILKSRVDCFETSRAIRKEKNGKCLWNFFHQEITSNARFRFAEFIRFCVWVCIKRVFYSYRYLIPLWILSRFNASALSFY